MVRHEWCKLYQSDIGELLYSFFHFMRLVLKLRIVHSAVFYSIPKEHLLIKMTCQLEHWNIISYINIFLNVSMCDADWINTTSLKSWKIFKPPEKHRHESSLHPDNLFLSGQATGKTITNAVWMRSISVSKKAPRHRENPTNAELQLQTQRRPSDHNAMLLLSVAVHTVTGAHFHTICMIRLIGLVWKHFKSKVVWIFSSYIILKSNRKMMAH